MRGDAPCHSGIKIIFLREIKGMVNNKPTESSLGVTVDDNLNYKVHVSDICKKKIWMFSPA